MIVEDFAKTHRAELSLRSRMCCGTCKHGDQTNDNLIADGYLRCLYHTSVCCGIAGGHHNCERIVPMSSYCTLYNPSHRCSFGFCDTEASVIVGVHRKNINVENRHLCVSCAMLGIIEKEYDESVELSVDFY